MKQYGLANHYSSLFCILPDKLRRTWYFWSAVVSTSVGQIHQSWRDQSSQRLSPTSRVSRSWSRQRVLSVRQGLQSTTSALCDCFPTSLIFRSSHRHSRTGTFFHTCKFKVAYLTQVLLVKEMITALKDFCTRVYIYYMAISIYHVYSTCETRWFVSLGQRYLKLEFLQISQRYVTLY